MKEDIEVYPALADVHTYDTRNPNILVQPKTPPKRTDDKAVKLNNDLPQTVRLNFEAFKEKA